MPARSFLTFFLKETGAEWSISLKGNCMRREFERRVSLQRLYCCSSSCHEPWTMSQNLIIPQFWSIPIDWFLMKHAAFSWLQIRSKSPGDQTISSATTMSPFPQCHPMTSHYLQHDPIQARIPCKNILKPFRWRTFLLGFRPIFRGKLAVSFRESISGYIHTPED